MDNQTDNKATKEHCAFCFKVILAKLKKESRPHYPDNLPSFASPLFVTWNIGEEEELRGCIGTFSAQDTKEVLLKYAVISAFEDSRFDPINLSEEDKLTCCVSFLTNFEEGFKAYDWEIGTHGIIIDFKDPNGHGRNATFLPEVALEHGFTKEKTLQQLIRKAGWSGDYKQVIDAIKLTRYQSSKISLSYDEFKKKYSQ